MKKASDILLIVGVVCSVLAFITYLICGFIFAAADSQSFRDAVADVLKNQSNGVEPTPEKVEEFVNLCKGLSVACFVFAVLSCAAVVVSILAKIKQTKVFYIVSIAVNFVAGSVFAFVGSILGLIAAAKNNNQIEE